MAALSLVLTPTAQAGATEPTELPPAPPAGLQVDAAGDGLTVSWQPAATGSTPTGYQVRVNPDCGGKRKTKTVAADTLTVTFAKVKHCDYYRVWVRARNSAGNSDKLETLWQRPQQQGNEPEYEGGQGTTTVMETEFYAARDLGYAVGCTGSGHTKCPTRFTLSGHSPLRITAIYVLKFDHLPGGTNDNYGSHQGIVTITLNGDWPDTTGWILQSGSLPNLSFDDANVTGRYATWNHVTVSDADVVYSSIGPITKPA